MKFFKTLWLLTVTQILCNPVIFAQDKNSPNDTLKTKVSFTNKGLEFNHGKDFYLNFRFRTQLRAGYFSRLDNEKTAAFDAQIRRLRLRFDGNLLSPKIKYKLQLAFSSRDLDEATGSPQILKDAVLFYSPIKSFSVGMGLTTLPGSRESIVSSGELQMPDRSNANSKFSLDSDVGIFVDKSFTFYNQVFAIKTAITTGEGRRQQAPQKGLALTGRLEYLPFGTFTNKGDFVEADIEFEPKPKLSLGFTLSKNYHTNRAGGQIGNYLLSKYDTKQKLFVDMQTIIADMTFKYRGWSFLGEYYKRSVDNFSINNFDTQPTDQEVFLKIPVGDAVNVQLGRMISKKDEISIRYTTINPHTAVKDFQYNQKTKAIGYSHYFNNHKFKIQGYLGLDDNTTHASKLTDSFKNRVNAMIQIEIGI